MCAVDVQWLHHDHETKIAMTRNACGWRHHNENEHALCPLNMNMHHINVPRNLPLLRHVTQIKTQTLFQCYCVICNELDHSESTRKQYDPKSHTTWCLVTVAPDILCVYICYIYKKGWSIGCLIAGLFLRWVHIHDLRITDQWFGIDYWTHALLVSSNWGSK